jgi:putative redox protein
VTKTPSHPAPANDGWIVAHNAPGGFATGLRAGAHALVVDEPIAVGGTDAGPTPYDMLLGALATCTAITVRMYARRKGWPLEDVEVRVRTSRSHAADCAECADKPVRRLALEHQVRFAGPLTEEQHARLLQIADRCPLKQILRESLVLEAGPATADR